MDDEASIRAMVYIFFWLLFCGDDDKIVSEGLGFRQAPP